MPEPIFKPIFADTWNSLPPAIQKHYANRPYCDDHVVVEGTLNITCNRWLRPILQLFKTVPPYIGNDIPVTVHFKSRPDSNAFHFERAFYFPNTKEPYRFHSLMTQVSGSEVLERMHLGIGWHSDYLWDGQRIILRHKGFSWGIGRFRIPLPITWLMGYGGAWEEPLDDNSFAMSAHLIHPIFGQIYEYTGTFHFTKTI